MCPPEAPHPDDPPAREDSLWQGDASGRGAQSAPGENAGERDELLLLDFLSGGLSDDAEAMLADRLPAERALRARHEALGGLLAAEQQFFQPGSDDGVRLAAWIRTQVRSEEAATQVKRGSERAPARSRGWARLLAWSVALHVLVLGLLAFALTEETPVRQARETRIVLSEELGRLGEDPDPIDSDFARAYPNLEWRDVSRISDELVLREQDTYLTELPEAFENVPETTNRDGRGLFDQPVGVVVAAVRRTNLDLKRRRLDLLGFNAAGTLRAVEKGLDYLAPRQGEDGSWSGVAGGRSDVEQTSVALLAFLGDGNTSLAPTSRKGRNQVVGRGIRWLRDQLFNASASDAERAAHLRGQPLGVLGPATVALCEDYMLSYGWLSPARAGIRAREIAQLAHRLESSSRAAAGPQRGAEAVEQPWAIWGLDAAARVGVVANTDANLRAFRAWVETASSAQPTLTAMSFLSVGTALLYSERGAEKPRFLEWSKSNAKDLAAKLGPGGYVRAEDPIGETALVVLGLQVAYRTY